MTATILWQSGRTKLRIIAAEYFSLFFFAQLTLDGPNLILSVRPADLEQDPKIIEFNVEDTNPFAIQQAWHVCDILRILPNHFSRVVGILNVETPDKEDIHWLESIARPHSGDMNMAPTKAISVVKEWPRNSQLLQELKTLASADDLFSAYV